MNLWTFEQALQTVCEAKPFVPFQIEFMNRHCIFIKNPRDITSYNGLFAVRHAHYFDSQSVCRLCVPSKDEPDFLPPAADLELDFGPDMPY